MMTEVQKWDTFARLLQFLTKLSNSFHLYIQEIEIPPEVLELQELSMNIEQRFFGHHARGTLGSPAISQDPIKWETQ